MGVKTIDDRIKYGLLVVTGMLVLAGVVVRPFTYLAFVVLAMITVFSGDSKFVFTTYFFLLPLAYVFKASAGSTSFFTYSEILLVICLLFRNYKSVSKAFFGFYFLYAVYVIVGMEDAYTDAVKQLLLPLLLFFFMVSENRNGGRKYAEFYSFGICISSFAGWLGKYIPNLETFINLKMERATSTSFYTRYAGLWGDPNYYSVNTVLAFCLIMYYHVKGQIPTWRAVIYYTVFVIFGALSGSKMFLLMIVLVFGWTFAELVKHKKMITATLLIIAAAVLVYSVFEGRVSVFNTTLSRLFSGNDVTTGRADKYVLYFRLFANRPMKFLIGNGLGNDYTSVPPHNTTIDYLDIYGLLGSLICLFLIISILRRYKPAKTLINYLPILALLLMWQALSMLRYLDFVWQMMLGFMIMYDLPAKGEQNEKDTRSLLHKQGHK